MYFIPKIREGVNFRKYLNSIIINEDLTLNEVGAKIFESIDGKNSIDDIANIVFEEYDGNINLIKEDVLEIIQSLKNEGLVQ